ncbi:MmcQ/YjbR family DNA-binding protein [Phenylobacterium sp.]|uniref:MmcQ/YjbR family DNA-binding protein n=1 Tax=Phenylobacterium sp. TaxID=1871053 RepID=UPI002E3416B2|nr:MmcQ/YjbR family DNA-binding protein [Phenylobacterium sp.]HEX4711856.1 MmcQ/YjbR family DNA-binding protein [Phenylobacterium sp.]
MGDGRAQAPAQVMADAADLRRIALALPEAYEDMHRRRPAFRVQARIFAMLGVTGEASLFTSLGWDTVAVVKLDREDQLNMIAAHPDAVQETETYGHHGWTYVRLDAIDEEALATILRLAWTHVAPKRLSRAS